MRIVVCVKHVPDLMAERRLDSAGRVDRGRGDGTLNETDENAVEAAVALAEEHGAQVIALTMGPDDAVAAVRRALQTGADRGVHVLDEALAGSDVFGTATTLAAAVRHIAADGPVDLVVLGMASMDGLTSMLPSALAAELGLPQLTLAAEVSIDAGTVTVRRELDHATEVLSAPLPAVVSVTDRSNRPRYPQFAQIVAARTKPVEVLGLADLGVVPASVGERGARTEVLSAARRPPRESCVLIRDEGDAGLRLAAFLATGLVHEERA